MSAESNFQLGDSGEDPGRANPRESGARRLVEHVSPHTFLHPPEGASQHPYQSPSQADTDSDQPGIRGGIVIRVPVESDFPDSGIMLILDHLIHFFEARTRDGTAYPDYTESVPCIQAAQVFLAEGAIQRIIDNLGLGMSPQDMIRRVMNTMTSSAREGDTAPPFNEQPPRHIYGDGIMAIEAEDQVDNGGLATLIRFRSFLDGWIRTSRHIQHQVTIFQNDRSTSTLRASIRAALLAIDGLDAENKIVYTSSEAEKIPNEIEAYKLLLQETSRLGTFHKWPRSAVADPRKLAKEGFFYFEVQDSVQCIFCQQVLHSWTKEDDPKERHVRVSSNCPMYQTHPSGNQPRLPEGPDLKYSEVKKYDASKFPKSMMPTWWKVLSHLRAGQNPLQVMDAKRPRYAFLHRRLSTFEKWPKSLSVKADKLSEAGFLYTYEGDIVECFFCGVTVHDWTNEDNPWVEHIRVSPTCTYVQMAKGEEFVQETITRVRETIQRRLQEGISASEMPGEAPSSIGIRNVMCKICLINPGTVLLLPCGHLASCHDCSLAMPVNCPICRKIIETMTNVYFT
jgi:baculoviral IAP repeat-containing protein 7/8